MSRQAGEPKVLAYAALVAAAAATSVTLGLLTLGSEPAAAIRIVAVFGIVTGPPACWAVWVLTGRLRLADRIAQDSSRRLDYGAAIGHEMVWEIDPEGVVTYMSEVAREMFGVDPAGLVGKSVFVLLPPGDTQDRARSLLADSLRERRGWSGLTFEAPHADGQLRWVETTGVAHLDEHGEVRGFTATTRRLDAEAVQRIALDRTRNHVHAVLSGRRLMTVFQPIVNVKSGEVAGHEALSRFPDEPLRGPDRWFADADRVGLGLELDLLAVQMALVTAQGLPDRGYVSINVTPATLQSGRLADLVEAAPIPGERLVVEITEHVSVEDYQTLRLPLGRLRALGVRLAVDDAGAGYASFRHILRLRPQFIKLDQEITRGVHADAARRALGAAVVMFALDVGATVIAEGVETIEDLAMVTKLGIDAAQGYLLGRPTADELEWRQHQRLPLTPQPSHGG